MYAHFLRAQISQAAKFSRRKDFEIYFAPTPFLFL